MKIKFGMKYFLLRLLPYGDRNERENEYKISIHLSHITWPLRIFKIPILYASNIDVRDREIIEFCVNENIGSF